jgi:integrase
MKLLFTEEALQKLEPHPARYLATDTVTKGFSCRIEPSGTKTYICQAIPLGAIRPKTETIGKVGEMPLEVARQEAKSRWQAMRRGQQYEKDQTRENTLYKIIRDYEREALDGKRTKRTIINVLNKDWLGLVAAPHLAESQKRLFLYPGWLPGPRPFLRDRPVIHLTKREIRERLDQIRKDRGKYAANSALSKLRACLAWATRTGRYGLQFNVAADLTSEAAGFSSQKEMRRKRILTDDELRRIWNACEHLGVYGLLVRLLILAGARLREIGSAEWIEFSHSQSLLSVPPHRFKTDTWHLIPFSLPAMEIINSITPNGKYIFTIRGKHPFTRYSTFKEKLDNLSQVTSWKLHDLRRTLRTNFSRFKISQPHIRELILGHEQGGIVAVYDQWDYLDEKREALEQWAAKLNTIVNPATDHSQTVVKLRA